MSLHSMALPGADHSLGINAAPLGDFDYDGDVGDSDVGPLVDCFFGPGVIPIPPAPLTTVRCLGAFDLQRDGAIDLADVADFTRRFGE
jgi:hypothetical protein